MNNKKVLIAISVFGLLLAIYVFTRQDRVRVGMKELPTARLKVEDIVEIDVSQPPKTDPAPPAEPGKEAPAPVVKPRGHVVLKREGDAWRVHDTAAPEKQFTVEESQAKAVLDAIRELPGGARVSDRKEKQAELEVSEEKGTFVKLTPKSGDAIELVFGKAAKGGSYVRAKDSDDIFVGQGRLANLVRKDVSGWRKKSLFELKPEDITAVTVKPKSGTPWAMKSEKADAPEAADDAPAGPPRTVWKLDNVVLPQGFRFEEAALGRIASSVASLRAQDFADGDTAKDDVTGFGGAHTTVEITEKGGKKVLLHLGNLDDKKRVFARVDGDPQVYLVASYNAQQIGKPLEELRDTTLFTAKPEDVKKLRIEAPGQTVVVERKTEGWALVEPKTLPAGSDFDAQQAAAVVSGLTRMRANRMLEGSTTEESGTDKGTPFIELTVEGGPPQRVRFGKDAPPKPGEEGGPKELFVKGADDHLYAIGAFAKTRYEKPFDLFKKPPPPPPGGGMGGMQGLESLPPNVRKQLEEQLKKNGGAMPQ